MRTHWCLWLGLGSSACGGGNEEFECGDVVIPENTKTIVQLTFETEKEGTSRVEFTPEGGTKSTTPEIGPTTTHAHTLVGIPGATLVNYTAIVDYDGGEVTCEGTVHTEAVPANFPSLQVNVDNPDLYDQPYVMMTLVQDPKVLAVVNRQGDVLWYMFADENLTWVNETFPDAQLATGKIGLIHAMLWPEGGQLIFNLQAQTFSSDVSSILWTTWDKTIERAEPAPMSHHAFGLHRDDGTVTYMALDARDWFDDEVGKKVSVVGDAFVELDSQGNHTEIFNVWDHFPVTKTTRWDVEFYSIGHDWTHGNAVNWNPDTGSYLFSFANINTFLEFTPGAAEPDRIFSWQNYTFGPDTPPFTYQHDTRLNPDGTVSLTSTLNGETSALVYEVDETNKEMTKVWSHGEGEGIYALALGENNLLPNGNRLISFGSAAVLREVTPDGEVAWELTGVPAETWLGNAQAFSDFYSYE